MVFAIGVVGAIVFTFVPSSEGGAALDSALSVGPEISNLGDGRTSSDGGGGLEGRLQNWRTTLTLATSWDVPDDESFLKKSLRPLFGLGPEMFAYSYPLVGDPRPDRHFTAHPHNYLLWILMGQGVFGLLLLLSAISLVFVSVWISLRRIRSGVTFEPGIDWIFIALVSGLIGKLVESQSGVARISDLAMTYAFVGAVIVLSELIKRGSKDSEESGDKKRTGMSLSSGVILKTMFASAIVMSLVASWLTVSWDMRRLSASLELSVAEKNADGSVDIAGLIKAQERAPERDSFTIQLADWYFVSAKQARVEGRADDAGQLAMAARDLLIEFELRNPYDRNTQMALAKTSSTLVDWGYVEFADEMRSRYLRLAELFVTYPSLVSTSATAMVRVGEDAKAIELADLAISTEDSTKPWAVAWYARGAALINLGQHDQAIESLTTAIEKEPLSYSAKLAHSALAFIYQQRGDTELFEIHSEAAK
ncbi:tetratricopeptide repeat protein [Candidatus Lucifugimonas marina]|uniref:Tetratricopeptide repeat protein n=1 Tax=Candidatus Lucifugimonas marina TaxID=3038979 RepID=A0AAJ6CR38_9CHLR|nr:tetratricopeptide repeat protein [SAR202 cluster bacterium JH702]MDG0868291.1 tetratricopeptide repeat protein [SAR202 cluster bacterium JH639]WFG34935.1 tetratricopeptide repeat protein [SAR202 cluster bacterium JH545]WFG38886.1 tetratricopeptide repeat protein [SAR202 cluster bacterium JH1073]